MALLDDLLGLVGTTRTRLRWRWYRLQERWKKSKEGAARRAEWVGYRHKVCPNCKHPADRDAKVCTACGAALGTMLGNRVGRIVHWIAPESTTVYTSALTLAHLCIFAVAVIRMGMGALGGLSGPVADALGAWSTFDVRLRGEWWRLVTANFLHLSALHLLMNSWSLVAVAPLIEHLYGRSRFLFLYVATGVAGMAASLAWRWNESAGAAGASAAIFGLIGVAIGYGIRRGGRMGKDLRDQMVRWAVWGIVICIFLPADNVAHVGGGVAGLVGGLLVPSADRAKPAGGSVALELAALGVIAYSFARLVLR